MESDHWWILGNPTPIGTIRSPPSPWGGILAHAPIGFDITKCRDTRRPRCSGLRSRADMPGLLARRRAERSGDVRGRAWLAARNWASRRRAPPPVFPMRRAARLSTT